MLEEKNLHNIKKFSKNSKIFMNFEVTNLKKILETSFTRKLSPKKFEVDNFIFSGKIPFFPKNFTSFWVIPLFFAHFEQLLFLKNGKYGILNGPNDGTK